MINCEIFIVVRVNLDEYLYKWVLRIEVGDFKVEYKLSGKKQ